MQRAVWVIAWLCLFLAPATARAATQNSCADPYWTSSLRCRALALLGSSDPPQPAPEAPASAAQIRTYTRVDLDADPNLRCVDGTVPVLYVDPAVGGPSDRWIISMTGGDNCSAQDLDNNGSFESGQQCFDDYLEESGELMGTANQPAMRTLSDEVGVEPGILSADPRINPVFARYNRVRIYKCGFDRHSGRATHLGVSATTPGPMPTTFNYDLFSHGQKIVLATLDALRGAGTGQSGLQFGTFVPLNGNAVPAPVTLPSIADAAQVLFVGHSDAAHGLYQNVDRYAAYLRAMPGFEGDVRVVHDGYFFTGPENEAAFDAAQNADPATTNTLFDQRFSGSTTAAGDYDAQDYYTSATSPLVRRHNGWLEQPTDSLGTILDASCVATHQASSDEWKCRDQLHVRLHHEATPALLREDVTDPNGGHTNDPIGHTPLWAELSFEQTRCDLLGYSPLPCPPIFTNPQWHSRLAVLITHFLEGALTQSEVAEGTDASGTPGSVYLWVPSCNVHEALYSGRYFFNTRIVDNSGAVTYREFVEQFANAPATGVIASRVHQLNGGITECQFRVFISDFE